METEHGKLPPPPGLIASLAAGFDSVANSITVIALPVLFDLFLWLGPHLRLTRFFQAWWNLSRNAPLPNLPDEVDLASVQATWNAFAEKFNLFAGLRTFPVGTPSLFSNLRLFPRGSANLLTLDMPSQTPFGNPITFEAGSFTGIFGWALLVMLTGWLVGALYYHWVSKVALKPETRSLWRSVSQALLLSSIWLLVLLVAGFPALVAVNTLALVSPALGQIVLALLGMLTIWLLVPIYFSAHGIFALQMDALKAILNSLRMAHFTLPRTGLFLLTVIVIGQGLRTLWTTPPSDSWWMLVGILGHAFVSTALLAASFIYYRNVNDWLKVVLEQLKTQTISAKA